MLSYIKNIILNLQDYSEWRKRKSKQRICSWVKDDSFLMDEIGDIKKLQCRFGLGTYECISTSIRREHTSYWELTEVDGIKLNELNFIEFLKIKNRS